MNPKKSILIQPITLSLRNPLLWVLLAIFFPLQTVFADNNVTAGTPTVILRVGAEYDSVTDGDPNDKDGFEDTHVHFEKLTAGGITIKWYLNENCEYITTGCTEKIWQVALKRWTIENTGTETKTFEIEVSAEWSHGKGKEKAKVSFGKNDQIKVPSGGDNASIKVTTTSLEGGSEVVIVDTEDNLKAGKTYKLDKYHAEKDIGEVQNEGVKWVSFKYTITLPPGAKITFMDKSAHLCRKVGTIFDLIWWNW